jgi:hypothetical protein
LLHFRTLDIVDKACTGMEALSLLVPGDWSFRGGINWSVDDVIMPASCGFEASGDGVDMQALPGRAFFWTGLPHVRLGHPVGSRYLGATVCPVLGAPEVIKSLILPSLRPEARNMRVTEEGPPANIGSLLGFGAAFTSYGTASSEGARLRVEYDEDGREYEEELFCTVTSLCYSVPSGAGEFLYTFWMADNMFAFRAKKGELDRNAGVLQTMAGSLRLNPAWFEKYSRIVIYLKDHQVFKPYSLRQLSDDVDKVPVIASSYQCYALRQSAYRWIADNLGNSRRTGEYYDPIQQISVSLPAGFDYAWSNEAGEYLLSSRVEVQPDIGYAGIWKMMEAIGRDASAPEPSTATAT